MSAEGWPHSRDKREASQERKAEQNFFNDDFNERSLHLAIPSFLQVAGLVSPWTDTNLAPGCPLRRTEVNGKHESGFDDSKSQLY